MIQQQQLLNIQNQQQQISKLSENILNSVQNNFQINNNSSGPG
jgi:hypothetical protein